MKKYLLSIAITSYNRIKELRRCLESVDAADINQVEIVVSEDHSPRRVEVKEIVEEFSKYSPYKVIFNSNEKNLGYDRNLKKLIDLSNGKYVLYISDDDAFLPHQLDKIINILKTNPRGVIYSPFYDSQTKEYRRMYKCSGEFAAGEEYIGKHIYDSILFSGLTFEKSCVEKINAEPFLNLIYFQVYMFIYCGHFYGGYYINEPLINCISDGENGFGLSDSSNNKLLAEKEKPLANPNYDKGLIAVIKLFDRDNGTSYFDYFQKEYNLRSVTFIAKARAEGKETLVEYWRELKKLDISLGILPHVYYYLFLIFGVKFSIALLSFPRMILLKMRGEKYS